MRSGAERRTEEPDLRERDEGLPPRSFPVAALLMVAAFVGTVAAVWIWMAAPAACEDTNVRSERFGYCLHVPDGWRVAEIAAATQPDQLFRPDGGATLTIQAVRTTERLEAFADGVREAQSDQELRLGDVTRGSVAGVRSLTWESDLEAGRGPVRARTVVFVSDGIAWRVQFSDAADGFERHERDVASILGSWRFL
jgi:hypothetical protein